MSGYVTMGLGGLVLLLMGVLVVQFNLPLSRLLGAGVALILLGAYCALTRTPVWSCSRVVWIVVGVLYGALTWVIWLLSLGSSVSSGRPG